VRHEGTVVLSCTCPAGESPVPVDPGGPGSRVAVRGEIRVAEADRQKPLRRERSRGPQHQVKPAASKDLQRESRATHVIAKAMSATQESRAESVARLSGVWGAARVKGQARNVRGPSASPQSRQSGSYKLKTKSSAAQRESEGMVVPSMDVPKNTSGGKRPCFGQVEGGGKGEGMTGRMSRSNHPSRTTAVKALHLQERLWAAAKRISRERVSRCDEPTQLTCSRRGGCTKPMLKRPSVSRVLEIGTHGLKGGPASPLPKGERRRRLYQ
jgi:hypothetical protein